MMRMLLVAAALLIGVGAALAQLRARGVPVGMALKMAAFGAGFVVSIKMTLGGYLALQGEAEPTVIELLGFTGSLALALCFGWVTLSLWRRRVSKSDDLGRSPDNLAAGSSSSTRRQARDAM